jgi:hypothetical protein
MAVAASPAPVGRSPAPLSYRAVLEHPEVQILAAARLASKMAGSTLSYGIMVCLAATGASQMEIPAASSASYLAALLFDLQGGTLANTARA